LAGTFRFEVDQRALVLDLAYDPLEPGTSRRTRSESAMCRARSVRVLNREPRGAGQRGAIDARFDNLVPYWLANGHVSINSSLNRVDSPLHQKHEHCRCVIRRFSGMMIWVGHFWKMSLHSILFTYTSQIEVIGQCRIAGFTRVPRD
jgi:hypothetical protein